MQKDSQSNRFIYNLLRETFKEAPRSGNFRREFDSKIRLFVVEKEDKNFAYVTDGYHIILALSSSRKNEVYYIPKNAPKTNFYKFYQKTQWFINYNSEPTCPDVR